MRDRRTAAWRIARICYRSSDPYVRVLRFMDCAQMKQLAAFLRTESFCHPLSAEYDFNH